MSFLKSSLLKVRSINLLKLQSYATRKRFYRSTGVLQSDNKWEVTLDHRRLKTPNGKVLAVENELLARAIAAEWDAQQETIVQPTMHLTALCNTALDNPGNLNSHDVTSYLLDFLQTDTLLFQADEEEDLLSFQQQKWGPIVEWFQKRFEVKQEVVKGLDLPKVTTETRAVLARHFLSYSFPALNAFVFGVEALKSIILMLACVERRIDPKEAVTLARLEEEFQVRQWGRVPWAHGLSQAELTARVAAAILLIHGSHETHSAKAKKKTEQLT